MSQSVVWFETVDADGNVGESTVYATSRDVLSLTADFTNWIEGTETLSQPEAVLTDQFGKNASDRVSGVVLGGGGDVDFILSGLRGGYRYLLQVGATFRAGKRLFGQAWVQVEG